MKKGKNLLAIVLCIAICYIPMQAAGYYKMKNVQYGGIKLYHNGVYQNASSQVVVIDHTTYLPVRDFGNMLGVSLDWNQNTQTVSVTGTTDTILSMQSELRAKDYQIAALTKELEILKNQGVISNLTVSEKKEDQYETTSGTDILGTELTATKKVLNNTLSNYFKDIDFDFSIALSSGKLKVNIEIENSADYQAFNKLSRSKIKAFMEEVCKEVRARHDDITLTGTIKYTTTNKTLYTFNYSKSDYLSYSNSTNTYYDDELLELVKETTRLQIEGYSGRIYVEDAQVSLNDGRERVTFKLYLDVAREDIKEAWNSHVGINKDITLRSYLKAIAKELSDLTDYEDIQGVLVNDATNREIGTYDYKKNELELKGL